MIKNTLCVLSVSSEQRERVVNLSVLSAEDEEKPKFHRRGAKDAESFINFVLIFENENQNKYKHPITIANIYY
jgi:hypothetical protein